MSDKRARVTGIGGVFFKARDPGALGQWYARHLGLPVQDWGGAVFEWAEAGTGRPACSVWSPFKQDTTYFEPGDRDYMINLRVDDLDALLAQLREEGCEVLDRREDSEQGRFGYVLDPEGQLVELWQPPDAASGGP
ncbi:VOC family protein [Pseudomarimonas salicorniae]|uniref:VOC family protein n=1 Tax=Pseudomarimonas salicorniae TaxID=2933270 RepID=A0ABT0GI80_9GAMM|nr:VOC family protein [Lysobacter sp. CAU 1642]MCK7593879.1 VOC family protein [Lysobacter sp. CAU 1642]